MPFRDDKVAARERLRVLEQKAKKSEELERRVGLLEGENERLRKRLVELRRELRKQQDDTNDSKNPNLEKLAREERWTEMLHSLRLIVDDPPSPEIHRDCLLRVAQICEKRLGRPEDALAAYRQILDANPFDEIALAALTRLNS